MEYKHIPEIMENMAGHINDEGQVVSRNARQQAILSAEKLGISQLEHGNLMIAIHQAQRHLKDYEKISKVIDNSMSKTKNKIVSKTKGKRNGKTSIRKGK